MSDEEPAVTREGLFDVLAGKAKETAGSLLGNDELERAGREQQADAEGEDHDGPTEGAAPPSEEAP